MCMCGVRVCLPILTNVLTQNLCRDSKGELESSHFLTDNTPPLVSTIKRPSVFIPLEDEEFLSELLVKPLNRNKNFISMEYIASKVKQGGGKDSSKNKQ